TIAPGAYWLTMAAAASAVCPSKPSISSWPTFWRSVMPASSVSTRGSGWGLGVGGWGLGGVGGLTAVDGWGAEALAVGAFVGTSGAIDGSLVGASAGTAGVVASAGAAVAAGGVLAQGGTSDGRMFAAARPVGSAPGAGGLGAERHCMTSSPPLTTT